ncbi:MAG TPA: rod shape-determining protein RodA [Streptosporangiaceae bacterium]|jgi:rod shape determining protein RodA|nr:rod shape-determining protein RodA [Streptosporangiaceae bacterium]
MSRLDLNRLGSSGLSGGRPRGPGAAYGKLAPVRPRGRWSAGSSGPASPRRSLLQRAFAKGSRLRQLDWVLLLTVLVLSFIGTLLVWSATRGAGSHTYVVKQLLNIVIGLALLALVTMLDYRQLRLYAPVLYAVSLLGLLAALTPLGTPVNGSKSWITLPAGFQIEPSEFGKISLILMSAMFLSAARNPGGRPGMRAVGLTLGCAIVPIALVEREPDLGVVIIMLLLLAGLIALSGLRLRWLAVLAAAGTLAVLAVLNLHLLHTYQLHRLTSFLNPTADPTGTGYNAAQAKIAVGSGGLYGQGLFHGGLIGGNFVPEQHTDFIFAVAGEELGFVGCALIIGLLAILLLRALRIAARADDQFGMLVASGIAIWFAAQSFINIGMTIGIMPVTGLPLPFVSYGGSAMFADMIAIGVLQTVHRHRSVFA